MWKLGDHLCVPQTSQTPVCSGTVPTTNKVTSASRGYPLSAFNKKLYSQRLHIFVRANSTLKGSIWHLTTRINETFNASWRGLRFACPTCSHAPWPEGNHCTPSDTSSIDHLVMREFVSGPPRYHLQCSCLGGRWMMYCTPTHTPST